MQSLDVISINIWDILISLCNLVILFLILKKFLVGPVKKVLQERQNQIADTYEKADTAMANAKRLESEYSEKISAAHDEADSIIKTAVTNADERSRTIVNEASERATQIMRNAEKDAALEKARVEDEIKTEIINVSTKLSEKLLGREIKEEDHRDLIDSFISDMGDE